ncbi:MAG: intein-containing phosphoribosylformylglycinamidine synthase II, partial [Actinobacteria bacterium]|nr:intein-containing phosphoribosylformylglycinamidine synthase II [Actinomycetota bacterium]
MEAPHLRRRLHGSARIRRCRYVSTLASVAAHPLHRALGLTDEENDRIRGLLGRDPNDFELAVFSVLWSEHCAYKHSALLLRRFPTDGGGVLQGPGENAGVVDVGGGEAVAFKVESHNHPSAVEPFQGAATGVGGILRDVVAMGARPIALLDGLRFGSAGWDFGRAVGGIGHYGNCLAGDERVIFRNSGKVREATIADLAEDRGPATPDAEWTAAPNRPFQLLSLDPESHEPIWSDVHRIFKRSAKGLLRIRASLGRELTVTTDHPVVIWESGRLVHRPASSLAPGDRLPLIASLPSSEAAASAIDLIDALDEPSIVQLPANWSPSNDVRTALIQLMPRADARHYWLNRRELPAWAFTAIEDLIAVPRNELRLRLEGPRSTSIPAVFPWTPATARLIGYYLSEGCCSRNGSTYKIVWTFGRSG